MNCRDICVLTFLDVLLVCSRTSAYYTKNYGNYNLTIRDNAGSQWTTQAGAQQWCRNNLNGSSSLASVTNVDLQANIVQFATDALAYSLSENSIILNAQLGLTDWQWINGQSFTGNDVQGQTMESNYLLYAYLLTGNYSLMASKPTEKRSFLCETSNCGGNGFQFSGRCYRKYDTTKVSWFDARNSCQNEGGDLASFEFLTKDTLSTLNNSAMFNPITSTDYWVGLKRLKWNWIDSGSEANFTCWYDGHPSDYNMKCICLGARNHYNWKWIECDCGQTQQFICFTALGQTTRSPSGLPAPTSLPNPTSVSPASPKSFTTNYSNMSSLKPNYISTTPANASESSQHIKNDQTIAVGIGVGLGVGVPLIILLIVVAALLIRKRKRNPVVGSKLSPSLVSESLDSPQIGLQNADKMLSKKDQPGAIYAMVLQPKAGDHPTAVTYHQPVVYDKLEHINQPQ